MHDNENSITELTMLQMQQLVDDHISQFKEGYFRPLTMVARLSEELGELAREVNHQYGEKPKKKTEAAGEIKEELGDLLFVIICFANAEGISLNEAFLQVMNKFKTRDAHRWTKIDQEGV